MCRINSNSGGNISGINDSQGNSNESTQSSNHSTSSNNQSTRSNSQSNFNNQSMGGFKTNYNYSFNYKFGGNSSTGSKNDTQNTAEQTDAGSIQSDSTTGMDGMTQMKDFFEKFMEQVKNMFDKIGLGQNGGFSIQSSEKGGTGDSQSVSDAIGEVKGGSNEAVEAPDGGANSAADDTVARSQAIV